MEVSVIEGTILYIKLYHIIIIVFWVNCVLLLITLQPVTFSTDCSVDVDKLQNDQEIENTADKNNEESTDKLQLLLEGIANYY